MPRYIDDSTGLTIESEQALSTAELEEAFSLGSKPVDTAQAQPAVNPLDLSSRQERDRQEFYTREQGKKQQAYIGRIGGAVGQALKVSPLKFGEGLLQMMNTINEYTVEMPGKLFDKATGGVLQPDIKPKPLAEEWSLQLRDIAKGMEPAYERGTPEYYSYNATLSLAQNLPPIALGTLTGSQWLALMMMGGTVAGEKKNELMEKGYSEDEASMIGGMYGAADVIGEKLSIGKVIKGPMLSRIVLGTAYDIPGELLTEVLQAGIDKGLLKEEDSFNWDRFIDTAIITGLSGPILGAGSGAISKMQKRAAKKQFSQAIDAGLETGELTITDPNAPKAPAGQWFAGPEGQTTGQTQTVEAPASEPSVTVEQVENRNVALTNGKEIGSFDGDILNISPDFAGDRVALARQLLEMGPSEAVSETEGITTPVQENVTEGQETANEDALVATIKTTLNEKGSIDLTPVVDLGRTVYQKGATTFEKFSQRMQEILSDVWDKVQTYVRQAWDVISNESGKITIEKGKKDGKIENASQQTSGQIGPESATAENVTAQNEVSSAYNQAETQTTEQLKQSQSFEDFERVIFGNANFGDTFAEDPLARHMSKEELKSFREKGILQARIEELKTSMSTLQDEIRQGRTLANDFFRAGRKIGALEQLERVHQMEAMRRQRQAIIREGTKLKNWLRSAEKKYSKLTTVDPEYRKAIQNAIDLNADGVENFIITQLQAGDVFMLDEGQLDLLREADPEKPTIEDLRNRVSIVKQLLYQGRKVRQIEVANERFERRALIDDINKEVREAWGVPEITAKEQLTLDLMKTPKDLPQKKAGLSAFMNNIGSILRKAEYIIQNLSGYKQGSLLYKATFLKVAEAERTEITLSTQTGKMLMDAFSLVRDEYANGELDRLVNVGGNISRWNMIAVALNSGNEGNRKALIEGHEGNFTDERIDAIVNALTPNEKAFARAIWNILEWQRPHLSKAYRSMTGEEMKLVEGQYYPLMFDKRHATRIAEAQEEQNLFRLYGNIASVGRGFTKTRTGGTMAVDLDFMRIIQHIDDVNHFVAYGEAVRDVNRIISNIKVKQAVSDAIGEPYNKALKQWLKSIANPQYEALPGWDRFMGKLKNNSATAILGFGLSTAFVQPLAMTQTINRLGTIDTLKGFLGFYKDWGALSEFVRDSSPFMTMRTHNFDATLKEIMDSDTDAVWNQGKASQKVKESFFSLIALTDKLVTMPTWYAAYQQEMGKSNDHQKAVDYADMIVRQSQSSGMPKDLAEVQRGNNTRKAFVMFYSYFSTTYNEMVRSVDLVRHKQVGMFGLMRSFWWLMVLPAVIQAAIKNRFWTGDDDELEDIPIDIAKELVGYGAGVFPIVGGIVNSLLNNQEFRPTPTGQAVKEIQTIVKTAPKLVSGDTSYHGKGVHPALRSGAMFAGYLFGLPSRQAMRVADEAWNAYDEGEVTWGNLYGLVYKERKK